MTREFSANATDGQWSGNILVDSVASTNLGLVMPNQTIDTIQVAAGKAVCLYRIQSSQTLMQKRYGVGTEDEFSCWESSKIPAYKIAPDDIINVYPLGDTGSTDSNVVAWLMTTRGFESMAASGVANNTATELKTTTNDQTIGDYAFNASMTGVMVAVSDNRAIKAIEVIDQTGGVVWKAFGGYRTPNGDAGGGVSTMYNFIARDLKIPILKGYSLKVTTAAP